MPHYLAVWELSVLRQFVHMSADPCEFVYYNCLPDAGLVIAGMGTALLVLVVGAVCFKRTQDRFILYT